MNALANTSAALKKTNMRLNFKLCTSQPRGLNSDFWFIYKNRTVDRLKLAFHWRRAKPERSEKFKIFGTFPTLTFSIIFCHKCHAAFRTFLYNYFTYLQSHQLLFSFLFNYLYTNPIHPWAVHNCMLKPPITTTKWIINSQYILPESHKWVETSADSCTL